MLPANGLGLAASWVLTTGALAWATSWFLADSGAVSYLDDDDPTAYWRALAVVVAVGSAWFWSSFGVMLTVHATTDANAPILLTVATVSAVMGVASNGLMVYALHRRGPREPSDSPAPEPDGEGFRPTGYKKRVGR